MSDTPDRRQIYYIPENFIGESRVHIGQTSLRVRYLIDSLILSIMLGIIAASVIIFAMNGAAVQAKITVALVVCGPGFLLGQLGYNGDPISTTLKNYMVWKKENQIRVYNNTPRLLGTDPIKAMQEDASGRDVIVDAINTMQENRKRKYEEGKLIEGENFEFEYDPGIDDYLEDNGDYADAIPAIADVDIGSGNNLSNIRYLYSDDGYNDDDPDEISFNRSDYETN